MEATARETVELCRISELTLNETSLDQENDRLSSSKEDGSNHGSEIMETDEFGAEKGASLEAEDFHSETNIIRSGKNDFINIYNNTGTVIIDLGYGMEQEIVDSTERGASRTIKMSASLAAASSMKTRRKKTEKLKSKRRLRQTLIPFPHRKRMKAYSAKSKEVNINVGNNSGNIVIGDGATCHTTIRQDYRSRNIDGEKVVADGTEIVPMSPPKRLVVHVDRSIMKWLHRFYEITNKIYPLRDNGRWGDFYQTVEKRINIARRNGQIEEEIFLTIEKSTALSYEKKNEQSMQVVKQANEMISNARGLKMKEFLTVMSHCQLAALYRRGQKMFKSNHAVVIAEQNAEFVPSYLAKAYAMYERASNQAMYTSIVSTQQPEREEYENEAREDHRSCISLCEKLLNETDDVYLRRHHFCFLKLALMNLNCRNANARVQPISADSIREASECIARMQETYSGEMSEATSMLLLTVQSDYQYRTGDFPTAITFAEKALKISQRMGFQLEIQELQERLELLGHRQARMADESDS